MSCELCESAPAETKHHLIPRMLHGKKRFVSRFGRAEMRSRQAAVCRLCHSNLHRLYDEKELGARLNTVEAIKADPKVARFLQWARKQRRSPQ